MNAKCDYKIKKKIIKKKKKKGIMSLEYAILFSTVSLDCEQSLFFFRFNEKSECVSERRAGKPRDARNERFLARFARRT